MADEEKKCLCESLNLLMAMSGLYDLYLTDMRGSEPLLKKMGDKLLAHINTEYWKPKYDEVRPHYDPLIAKCKTAVNEALYSEGTGIHAVEVIKDVLHREPKIRHLFTCGPVFRGENETDDSKAIFEAMDIIANSTSDHPGADGADRLMQQYTKSTCIS